MRKTHSFRNRRAFPEVNRIKKILFEYSFLQRFSIAIINLSQIP